MNIMGKIIAGDPAHRTRFHDEKGNRLDASGMAYAPRALAEAVLRVSFGIRPERPWISYRAVERLKTLIRPDWRVAEFGSGMSTIWFARRVQFLFSIEADPQWHQLVTKRLRRARLSNFRYELRPVSQYDDLSEFPDGYFDLVLVDGDLRPSCVRNAVPKVRRFGWLYLDNTDKDVAGGDLRMAEEELIRATRERNGSYEYFTDLVPSQLIATQGMLARL